MQNRPRYYFRDGTPIRSTELMPDFLQWATLFEETADRRVDESRTLYGERISTVWLGLDHNYFDGPPLLFETMLFAPRKHRHAILAKTDEERAEAEAETEVIKIKYPHDHMMQRYTTEAEARQGHLELKLRCLVPPRWRKFVFYTLGEDDSWN